MRSSRSAGVRVRKLDPPVRAALRLGAYQLAFIDGVPRYAAVNESVELVRGARLERAVPFANAVLRRLADGARALCDGAPRWDRRRGRAAPLVSGLGRRDVVARARRRRCAGAHGCAERGARDRRRLVRGAIDGREDPLIPGAWVVDRVDETALAEGRIWPQSRGSQLVGHVVGSLAAPSGRSTCARLPAARRRCSPAR